MEQQAKAQPMAEAGGTAQRRQKTKGSAQPAKARVTEAQVNAVLQDPRYSQAGLTKGAAQQVAQLKADEAKARQEQRQGEDQYQRALRSKGRQEIMEGWGQEVADNGSGSDKLRRLGLA